MSGIDSNGKISLWDYAVYSSGERGAAGAVFEATGAVDRIRKTIVESSGA